ncbi:MAG: hypothetical protein JO171_14405 [Paludibacterium sp.]|nr:hypothetical protein [Paludibacterium sp.]MBV8048347.1 hypothetical protein [Paludibacterium sp.]
MRPPVGQASTARAAAELRCGEAVSGLCKRFGWDVRVATKIREWLTLTR